MTQRHREIPADVAKERLRTHLVVGSAFPQRHDPRHLLLGDLDLPAAEGVLVDVAHAKVREALLRLLDLLARRHVVIVGRASCIRC